MALLEARKLNLSEAAAAVASTAPAVTTAQANAEPEAASTTADLTTTAPTIPDTAEASGKEKEGEEGTTPQVDEASHPSELEGAFFRSFKMNSRWIILLSCPKTSPAIAFR